jgi:hypothetical protein
MRFLLAHTDTLDIFAWIEDHGPFMNDKQFSLAIKGLRIRARSKEAAHRILVKGQSRQQVIEDLGMQKAAVSQLINNILKNLDEQLTANGLVYQQYVLPKSLKPVIDALEEEHLKYYVKDPKDKKK